MPDPRRKGADFSWEEKSALHRCGKKYKEEGDARLFQVSSIEYKADAPSDGSLAEIPTHAFQASFYVLLRWFPGAPNGQMGPCYSETMPGYVCSRA